MNKINFLFFLFFICNTISAQELKKEYQELVYTFIQSVKEKDIPQLKALIRYPLRRYYPLPDVKTETDFEKRFSNIFDDSLSARIVNSDIKKDWSAVGWRGIMLDRGIVWLDIDGMVLAINYESSTEKIERDRLLKKDKKSLSKSIRNFDEPKLFLKTETQKIRIDIMPNGSFRFTSWSINSPMSKEPEIIIENGTWMPDGSGGNNWYEFKKGGLKYICYINHMRSEDTPPASVIGFRNEKEIYSQDANIIRN